MHGKLTPPHRFSSSRLILLTLDQVGLKRGIGRVPSNLHRHHQYHHLDTDLPECDLPSHCVGCRRGRHQWRFLSVWVDPTGVSVGHSLRPCDEHYRAVVYGYTSQPKEWHRSLYTDGMPYYQLTIGVCNSRCADRAHTTPSVEHHLARGRPELDRFVCM